MPRSLRCALCVLAALAALPASGRETLTIGITQFPASLHPTTDAMLARSYVLGAMHRPLVTYGPDWKLTPLLLERVPTLENGDARRETTPEGKPGIAVTVRLRPDARWGDATPVTSADLAFAWEVGRHPQVPTPNAEFYRSLYRLDLDSDRTATLHFDRVTFTYNALTGFYPLPAHLDRAAFADPSSYAKKTLYDTKPTLPGLYTGPYRLADLVAGSHLILEPNPAWAGPRPAFGRVVLRAVENTAALEANLLSGAIDMIAGELGITVDQALSLEKRHGHRFRFLYKPGLSYEHIELNLAHTALADRRVRQALLLALDREAISRQLFGGKQPVAATSVNPLDAVWDPAVPAAPYDPTGAGRLLDEAGWPVRTHGMRANVRGETLTFEFATTAGNRTRELIQQALVSQWRQVGVEARPKNEPARVLFGQTLPERRFAALALFAWISAPESVPRSILHSTQIPTASNGRSGQNFAGYHNPEMDSLLDAIEEELHPAKRRALWRRFQNLYAAELPALPLFFRADPFVLPPWLDGVEPTGHQSPTTLWIERWREHP